jgi:hypothetical protein
MAVKSSKSGDKLILELDNGDVIKLEDVMKKWAFKDHQSLIRFVVSMLILNENNSFSLRIDGRQQEIVPSADFLKDGGAHDGNK